MKIKMQNEAQKDFIECLTDGGMAENIFRYAYNRCFSEDEAGDLCHEIITEILTALQNDDRDITNLNAYIWQIAHNTYVNHVNRQKREKAAYYPLCPDANINVTMEDDILERIVDSENLSRIKREIAALPEIYRNSMIMHYLDGLSVSEIAGSLGIPENRVKQRLFAAREKIKKEVFGMNEKEKPVKKTEKTKEAAAIDQKEQFLQQGKSKILDTLASVLEFRCKQTGEHPERAALYVKILIDAMIKKGIYTDEIKNWDINEVVSASRVHDIGKIAISDNILMKSGKLTQDESEIMRSHISKGEEILDKISAVAGDTQLFRHAKLFIGSHHERWNGEGFPRGLKGENIPLQGRIMAVADVYETLVSERPYKAALTYKEAEDFIKNNSGIIFDPMIAGVLDDDGIKAKFAETAMQFNQQ